MPVKRKSCDRVKVSINHVNTLKSRNVRVRLNIHFLAFCSLPFLFFGFLGFLLSRQSCTAARSENRFLPPLQLLFLLVNNFKKVNVLREKKRETLSIKAKAPIARRASACPCFLIPGCGRDRRC